VQEEIELPEEEIYPEDEPELEDDLLQELEDLIEVPEDELVEVLPEEDFPEELVDELGLYFHDINRQPLLSREDEFRLYILIQAGQIMYKNLSRWTGMENSDDLNNAILNIYQNTLDAWDELGEVCASSGIPQPELGEIFSEIFLQRILGQTYYSASLARWFEILPSTGAYRERAGKLALEIPISIMALPVEVIIWMSGYLARDERTFPPLSELANWLIYADDITFDIKGLLEVSQGARERMILSNLRLVIWTAKRYQGRGVELADLVQAGTLGLLRAVQKFDPVRGYKFSTFATWWVRQAITRYIADTSRLIRLPVHFYDRVTRVLRVRDNLVQRLHRQPTLEEIAAEIPDLCPERVHWILLTSREPLSLDMKVGNDDEDSVLGDFIPDYEQSNPVITTENNILREVLDRVLENLPARERKVLTLRYGLGGEKPYTLEEVGEKMGVTRERIRQIEGNALSRLRHPRVRRMLRDFLG